MSWYTDPQLYICRETPGLKLYRMKEPIGTPIALIGIIDYGFLDYSKHLSLANNKESDFNAFLSSIKFDGVDFKLINCQGWVVYQKVSNYHHFTWAREPLDSPFYRLPGISTPETVLLAQKEALDNEKQALQRIISDLKARNSTLEARNSTLEDDKIKVINDLNGVKAENLVEKRLFDLEATVSTLRDEFKRNYDAKKSCINEIDREKAEKQVLKEQISDLTSKLKECCGTGGGSVDQGPWKTSNSSVPNNWAPFEDLDVLNIPKNTSLKIIKAPGALKFTEDTTTNVQASCFYGGLYPIVAVNIEELTPDKHEARFDPDIWGSYNNAGTSYAARKLFEWEI